MTAAEPRWSGYISIHQAYAFGLPLKTISMQVMSSSPKDSCRSGPRSIETVLFRDFPNDGGYGVSRDTIVDQAFREIRAFRIYDDPTEVHKWSLAKKIKRHWKASQH